MRLDEIKLPRRVAAHLVTSVCFFTFLVVLTTRFAARDEYYYSWEPIAQRQLPWHASIHFILYQYAWCLLLISMAWGTWVLSRPMVTVGRLITYVSVMGNLVVAWGLWTVWTIYYLNRIEFQKFLEDISGIID
ncbi:hypothetical protein DTL42_07920 [Bremerella cremea]|uniref:Uncharacterized protein n=1 Tax=Bremerella cremea TaxID=1031537 RepID=A0A368KV22_9BACT|nr:hypothetical protein [Bremerella cremea]RCS52754.1 hypothetical protein DTL42_07920 [Bremerella cremea]